MSAVLVEDGVDKGAIWHFGEPTKEQRALQAGNAWADLSHLEVIAVSGEDRLKWLHDLTTQFLKDLGVNLWKSAMILDPQGHIEYQFNLVDDGLTTWLVVDPGYSDALCTYLKKMKFMLVSEAEANLKENKLSISSPIGKALLGKAVGEKAKAITPGGEIEFEILKISI